VSKFFFKSLEKPELLIIIFGLILNLSIAGATPPVGTLMFTTCSISNVKIEDYIKEGYPFILATIIALLLITYFPIISMLLPNLLM